MIKTKKIPLESTQKRKLNILDIQFSKIINRDDK